MDVLDWGNNAGHEEFSLVLGKFGGVGESAPKIGSWQEIHDEVEVIPVVESADHICDEGRVESLKNFPFVEDVIDTFLQNDEGFAHFLHSV